MDNVCAEWISELPAQFQDKEKIAKYISIFAGQLQELLDVFIELYTKRDITEAVGKQLDGIGNIVALTRAESVATMTEDVDITDALYSLLLRYKMRRNRSYATTPEVIDAIKTIFNPTVMTYAEVNPAEVTITLQAQDNAEWYTFFSNEKLLIKPGGVKFNILFTGAENFAFRDTYDGALGFGVGKLLTAI